MFGCVIYEIHIYIFIVENNYAIYYRALVSVYCLLDLLTVANDVIQPTMEDLAKVFRVQMHLPASTAKEIRKKLSSEDYVIWSA